MTLSLCVDKQNNYIFKKIGFYLFPYVAKHIHSSTAKNIEMPYADNISGLSLYQPLYP